MSSVVDRHCVVVPGLDGPADRALLDRARSLARRLGTEVRLLCLTRRGGRGRRRRDWASEGVDLLFLDELPPLADGPYLNGPAFLTRALRLHSWLRSQGTLNVHYCDRGASVFVALQAKRLGLAYAGCDFHCLADGGLCREREAGRHFMGEGVSSVLLEYCERWTMERADQAEPASTEAENWIQARGWNLPNSAPAVTPRVSLAPSDVTVCIPHHNYGAYLDELFASLEGQTALGFEVLVVDDGSTDAASLKVFGDWESRKAAAGWRFIRKANGGLGQTRNYMAALARTRYVLFMDADNVAEPVMVERFVAAMTVFDGDILTCQFRAFEDASPTLARRILYSYAPVGDCLAAGYHINIFGDANMMVRRDALLELGGFFEERGVTWEDWEFLARAVLAGKRLAVVPEPLFLYRVNRGGYSARSSRFANIRRVQACFEAGLPAWTVEILQAAYGREARTYRSRGLLRLRAWLSRPIAVGWRDALLALAWALSNQALKSLQRKLDLCPGDDDGLTG